MAFRKWIQREKTACSWNSEASVLLTEPWTFQASVKALSAEPGWVHTTDFLLAEVPTEVPSLKL